MVMGLAGKMGSPAFYAYAREGSAVLWWAGGEEGPEQLDAIWGYPGCAECCDARGLTQIQRAGWRETSSEVEVARRRATVLCTRAGARARARGVCGAR
jgi:hypothetical protein